MEDGTEADDWENSDDKLSTDFASSHRLIFDFVANAQEIVIRFQPRWSWVGPDYLYQQVSNTNFEQPSISQRGVLDFNFNDIPQPGILSRLSGYGNQELRTFIIGTAARRYATLHGALGRPPRQEEQDVITQQQARSFTTATSMPVLLGTTAFFRSLTTSARGQNYLPFPFRYPFKYERSQRFESGVIKMPFSGSVILSGPFARALQNSFRHSLFVFAGLMVSRPLVLTWLAMSDTVALADPRLKDIRKAYQKIIEEKKQAQITGRKPGNAQQEPMPSTPKVIRTVDRPSDGKTKQQTKAEVNGGWQGSSYIGESSMTGNATQSNSNSLSVASSDAQNEKTTGADMARWKDANSEAQSYSYSQVGPRSPSLGNSFDFHEPKFTPSSGRPPSAGENDDLFFPHAGASATNGGDTTHRTKSQSPTGGSVTGSAWDRIRQSGGYSRQGATGASRLSSGGESTSDEESRNTNSTESATEAGGGGAVVAEQSRAQAEFDALLERDRAGVQDASSARQNGRWR